MMIRKLSNILRDDNLAFLLGFFGLLLLCMPYIIFGEDSYITIHDNLDGIIANLKLLKDNHALFCPNAVLPMMGGIRRASFGNEWNLTIVPFALLPCYWANVVNIIVVKATAYIGMYLLLKKYATKSLHPMVCALIAFAFACVPYYATVCGISAAGIPLVVYAFINLQNKKHLILSYALVFYYALYSFLPFSGIFICVYLLLYGVCIYVKEQKMNVHYAIGFCLLCCIYLLSNYQLLASFIIDSSYISHRTELTPTKITTLKETINYCWNILCYSQYHAGPFPAKYILQIFVISLLLRRSKKMWIIGETLFSIFLFILLAKCLPIVFPKIHFFREFQFDRFYFLYPCVGFVMFGILIENILYFYKNTISISKKYLQVEYIFVIFITLSIFTPIIKSLYNDNLEIKYVVWQIKEKKNTQPSFRQFYDEKLFANIIDSLKITPSDTKIVSIGIFPAVAEYNGFYCLDGYMSDYELSYKHNFRKIIQAELELGEGIREYFDNWGNRCYMFSSELEKAEVNPNMISKNNIISITPQYNIEELKQLGAQFVFSTVNLNNIDELGLTEQGVFTTEDSFWQIFVYRIIK